MLNSNEFKQAVAEAKEQLKQELLEAKGSRGMAFKKVKEKYVFDKSKVRGDGELTQVIGMHESWIVYDAVRRITTKIMGLRGVSSIASKADAQKANDIAEKIFALVIELAREERGNHDNKI